MRNMIYEMRLLLMYVMYECMYVYWLGPLRTVYSLYSTSTIYTSCYEVVLYTDDVQLLYQNYFYMTRVPIMNQTNRYILYLLNTDDINYTMKTF